MWTPDHGKVASIGMRIHGGVTSHGFALNIAPDMAQLSAFVACGLPEVAMTSLAESAAADGRPAPAEETVRAAVAEAFEAV